MQAMIGELLDSALIDVGQLTIEYQPVRLARLALEVAEDMQRRATQHRLVVDFPADFPLLEADPRVTVPASVLDDAFDLQRSVRYAGRGVDALDVLES